MGRSLLPASAFNEPCPEVPLAIQSVAAITVIYGGKKRFHLRVSFLEQNTVIDCTTGCSFLYILKLTIGMELPTQHRYIYKNICYMNIKISICGFSSLGRAPD